MAHPVFALCLALATSAAELPRAKRHVNSLGMHLVRIEPGRFQMGESRTLPDALLEPLTHPTRFELKRRFPQTDPTRFRIPFEARRHGDFDEHPVHSVRLTRAYYLAATEVTNFQYEQFDPAHRALRGRNGHSEGDDEAVVFVSWRDAQAFCEWLSRKEGLPYRLPTEAEWEFAARAGANAIFPTGDELAPTFLKNARSADFRSPATIVPLTTGRTPANPWGLFDMAGNVEEWASDWYGPYNGRPETDPTGPAFGDFRVTRGGSHSTDPFYLRSANRAGAPPDTRAWTIGFRVALARPLPLANPGVAVKKPVNGETYQPVPKKAPYFRGPRRFVRIPPNSHGPLFSHHNHDTAIAECPNGDLLAIWYTCEQEGGRELAIASSRLRHGAEQWDPAEPFWDAPDRNDHAPALWFDGQRTLYHINSFGLAGPEPLAILLRTSTDDGRSWSPARFITPEFGLRNRVGQVVFRSRTGAIVFSADTAGGSTAWVSRDGGHTWYDSGGNIRGIHAGIVELEDGRWLAFGRGQNLEDWMPMSLSSDQGRTWTYAPSPFPPIGGGQRLVLMRLREGPLFIASFAENAQRFAPLPEVASHRGLTSIFAALSYDDGKTWPVSRVVTDGLREHPAETTDGGRIRMSPSVSEPQGYLAATQSRDGLIHLISSVNHYAFNQAWLEQPTPQVSRDPQPQANPRVAFTVAAEAASEGEIELWDPSGAIITNHYRFTLAPGAWRIAVRADTVAQVYRDGQLIQTLAPEILMDWRLPARGRHLETRGGVRTSYIHE
jgi:formylglycine-generating enzyme required for sulfatase activity